MKVLEIVLELHDIGQLILSRDSLFYGKRWLTPDAEEAIVEQATLAAAHDQFTLKIYLANANEGRKDEISTAIHQHFAYQRKKSERQLKRIFKLGWRSLLISIVILSLIISLIPVIIHLLPDGSLSITFRELLVILGWVALWRPVDFLLYEWRPFKREVDLFRKLEQCSAEILPQRGK